MLEGLRNFASQAARYGVAATTAGLVATHGPAVAGKIVSGAVAGTRVGAFGAALLTTQAVGIVGPAVINAGWFFGEKAWDLTARTISNYEGWKSQRDLPADHSKAHVKIKGTGDKEDKDWFKVDLTGVPHIDRGWSFLPTTQVCAYSD